MPCFSYYLFMFFSSTKSEKRRANRFCSRGVLAQREGASGGESGRRENMGQIMCTHVSKSKNDAY
jgi:hypothetical protein